MSGAAPFCSTRRPPQVPGPLLALETTPELQLTRLRAGLSPARPGKWERRLPRSCPAPSANVSERLVRPQPVAAHRVATVLPLAAAAHNARGSSGSVGLSSVTLCRGAMGGGAFLSGPRLPLPGDFDRAGVVESGDTGPTGPGQGPGSAAGEGGGGCPGGLDEVTRWQVARRHPVGRRAGLPLPPPPASPLQPGRPVSEVSKVCLLHRSVCSEVRQQRLEQPVPAAGARSSPRAPVHLWPRAPSASSASRPLTVGFRGGGAQSCLLTAPLSPGPRPDSLSGEPLASRVPGGPSHAQTCCPFCVHTGALVLLWPSSPHPHGRCTDVSWAPATGQAVSWVLGHSCERLEQSLFSGNLRRMRTQMHV